MTVRRARRKPGENRERLIEAGLVEFGLFGFHGASTAAIAARAEVPQPHVYANFSNKQALFAEVCATASRIILEHESGTFERDGKPTSESTGIAERFRTAQRAVLQAIAAVQIPELTDELLTHLVTIRDALGPERFTQEYGAVSEEMINEALTRD